jgi:uncharacterized membrane protein
MVALLLGTVAGLRTMTAPAVLLLVRRPSRAAGVLAVMALAEYAGDLYPKAPARTAAGPLLARIASGAFCGWYVNRSGPRTRAVAGPCAGALGAVAGAYGGLLIRRRAMARIGPVPAAIVEDVVALAGAVLIARL